jgi:hypothetical protein
MPDEPTQETPTGDDRRESFGPEDGKAGEPHRGGLTIPVPEKADVMAAFRKVAKADEDAAD